jgi:hypothetical protein
MIAIFCAGDLSVCWRAGRHAQLTQPKAYQPRLGDLVTTR